uniref:Uncharacterized protein n=1 Tax=Oryza glumipatula TaxID=40148 RepID=A0A0E0BJX2_9ORYZ
MPNSGSSWVVNMQEMIDGIGAPPRSAERPAAASIYRVPEYINNLTNRDAYRPQLVSLGPFHHGDPALLPMESHKRRAVAIMVKRSGKPLEEFVAAVEGIRERLQVSYQDLDDEWRHGRGFVELMLTDGCFLLEIGGIFQARGSDDSIEYYGHDDPVFSEHGRLYLFSIIKSDVVLMENSLPLLLLQKLTGVAYANKFQVAS